MCKQCPLLAQSGQALHYVRYERSEYITCPLRLGLPEGSRGSPVVAAAGDNAASVQVTMSLVNDIGFDRV